MGESVSDGRARNNWVLEDSILKVMIKLGMPIAASEALNIMYSMADIYWLGRVGRDALASVSASWPVIWLIVSVAAGVFSAGLALVSQYWGMGDYSRATKAGGQVLALSVMFGIPIAAVSFLTVRSFLQVVGVPETTLEYAAGYARIISLGIPFIAVYESFSAIYAAAGNTMTPLKIRSLGVIINVVLDPIFIFGYFGFEALGVGGAAIATVISEMIVAAVSIAYIALKGVEGHYLTLSTLIPDREFTIQIIRIGYPISALTAGEASGFVILVHIISLLGSAPLAAWGIADRLLSLFHVFIAGLLGATSTMIGQSLGAGMYTRAKSIAKRTSVYGSAIMAAGILVLIPFRYQVATLFSPGDEELINQVADFILIMGPSVIFFTVYLTSRAIARGSGHTKPVMFFGLLRLWVLRNSLAYLFAITAGLGVKGLWIGMAISNYITGAVALWWILFGNWTRPVVGNDEESQ